MADQGILAGYAEGMVELTSFFATQRTETLEVAVSIQKAILRVLKAGSQERKAEEEKQATYLKALYGKDAGKITLPTSFPHELPHHADGTCRVEMSLPKVGEVDIDRKGNHLHDLRVYQELSVGSCPMGREWKFMAGTACGLLHCRWMDVEGRLSSRELL